MRRFTIPAETYDERNLNKRDILHLIQKHRACVPRLETLEKYYGGQHKILSENRANKLVCNHAKDISDTASSYFIGNPVSYKSDQDIVPLTDELESAGADEADGDLGLDLSVYGRAYEYIYAAKEEAELRIKNLPPQNTFVVCDDTIEENELFGVYYFAKIDDTDKTNIRYVATVVTKNYKYVLNIQDTEEPQSLTEIPELHYLDEVPIIEYQNNKLEIGDYELQIPLINAYNALMSDRITDKEQFIDAILAIYGTLLADVDELVDESVKGTSEGGEPTESNTQKAYKKLKSDKVLELPDGTKAEYLTRTFDEPGVEVLKKAIEQDIHKFSHIPCMTDEAFGGNVSGVAMEFKLLGMENITKIKTRYYKKGLRKRLRIFANYLNKRSGVNIDIKAIKPTFSRALPKNLLEISQIVANLWGKVSRKTLLSQIPFVDDPDEELKAVEKEESDAFEKQKEAFGLGSNSPPDEQEDEPPEKKRGDVDE